MERRRLRFVSLVAVAALTISGLAVGHADRQAHAAPTVDLLVGDSVMAGMSSSARSALPEHFFDAKVCRRLISTSCTYGGVRPSTALSVIEAHQGLVNRAIVVAAGYNDSSIAAAVDAVVAEARRQHVPHVIWLSYREAGTYASTYQDFNHVLDLKAFQYPELEIADWAELSRYRGDWVASDGLHLTATGAQAMAGLIADTLAGRDPGIPIPPPPPSDPDPELPPPPPPPPPTRCDLAGRGVAPPPVTTQASIGESAGLVMRDVPVRLVDTRGPDDGKLRAGHVLRVDVPQVPAAALAVAVTVTIIDPCGPGYVTAFACGDSMPPTSTVNATRGGAMANLALVELGEGAICVYSSVAADLVVDLAGHLEPSGRRVTPTDSLRLVDTRPGYHDELDVADGHRTARSLMTVPVRSVVGDDVDAVWVNVAVTDTWGDGFVSVYPGPCTATPPTVSNLNHLAGETMAAAALSKIGSDGSICILNHAPAHLLVDLAGTTGPDGLSIRTVENIRIADTRSSGGSPASTELGLEPPLGSAPAGVAGLVANLVPIGEQPGFVSLRDCTSSDVPRHSTVNHGEAPIANLGVVAAADGHACVFRSTEAHLVVDAAAWLVP